MAMRSEDRRIRFSVTEENYEWMRQQDLSASVLLNNLLNSAREAEEIENEDEGQDISV